MHETESQVILNGSRDINFTMDLVLKDIGLFDEVAKRAGLDLELSPMLVKMFKQAIEKYGPRELSPNIIKKYEEQAGLDVTASGFPAEILDDEPEEPGYEVVPTGRIALLVSFDVKAYDSFIGKHFGACASIWHSD